MSASTKRARAPQRWLLLAFVFVTVSFVSASAYSQAVLASIDRSANAIATNASPSIERLAQARADLGELQSAVFIVVRAAIDGKPESGEQIRSCRAELNSDIDGYLVLPRFDGEEIHWKNITGALRSVEQSIDRILALVAKNDAEGARIVASVELRDAIERASIALRDATSFNARHAADLATRIEIRRQRAMNTTIALDVVCAIAAIVLALALSRTVRAYGEVVESRNELLERRADELEVFASRVSHDILSPLGTITLALGLVQKQAETNPQLARVIDRAIAGVDRAARIVRDLLSFARAGATPVPGERSDLARAVRDVLDGVSAEAAEAHVDLDSDVEHVSCAVACSPGVLTSIVANLVRNALKYMGDAKERCVSVRAHAHGSRVSCEVVDTGPGIPPGMLDVIFLPHVRGPTAGRPGLGLGLATVKRLVEAHGGRVWVRSRLGAGTTFGFELPCEPRSEC